MNQAQRREVVVVTGSSGGVGRAVAQAFGKRGASVCLVARGGAGLEGAKRDVERLGGRAIIVTGDSAQPETHERAARAAEEAFGTIDIWVNVAFTTVFAPFTEITPDEYERVTDVTYHGYVYGTQAALRRMLPRNRGHIVQVGSALAYRGIPLQTAYCGAKHAIQGFTESLRTELIHNRRAVRLTMVQLPAVNTPQFTWGRNKMPRKAQPVPPIYQPELVAEAIYWAAHRNKRQLYVGGSTVIVIMGNKFFAKFGDWYLGRTGYTSQMRDERQDPSQPNNLFEPVDVIVDYGARGAFDDRSTSRSPTLWATRHQKAIGAALAGLAGGALAGSLLALNRGRG